MKKIQGILVDRPTDRQKQTDRGAIFPPFFEGGGGIKNKQNKKKMKNKYPKLTNNSPNHTHKT